jgi:small basic protein (TIGR04137 family)
VSIHKTLRSKASLTRSRNVFTRWERIEKLKEKGEWNPEKGSSVFGLKKVRTVLVKAGKKKKAKKKEEGAEGEAKPAEGAAAPAAGAKPAAGAAAAPAAGAKKK